MANNVVPDQMAPFEPSHLDLLCLHRYMLCSAGLEVPVEKIVDDNLLYIYKVRLIPSCICVRRWCLTVNVHRVHRAQFAIEPCALLQENMPI